MTGSAASMTDALPSLHDALEDMRVGVDRLVPPTEMVPFDRRITGFVGALSRAIVKHPGARQYPEIMALGHWMRPAALRDMEARFRADLPANCLAAARGLAFHIAPSNVDTIFLYSCVLSLLAGNPNIVRLSARRSSPQTRLLLGILRDHLADPNHAPLATMLRFVTYSHDDRITAVLSARAMLRVVWGGDGTIGHIRTVPLHPLGRDVSFPDRWSVSLLNAAAVLGLDTAERAHLARNFTNDGYWFHQMACSSPRAVIWLGEETTARAAADLFWPAIHKEAARFGDDFSASDFVGKRTNFDAAVLDGVLGRARVMPDNLTTIAALSAPDRLADFPFGGGGLFVETRISALDALTELLDQRCQTVASFGVAREDWQAFLSGAPRVADRIVPVGRALEFAPIWDGMELLREFTRLVSMDVETMEI
jgi:hypothetical protein